VRASAEVSPKTKMVLAALDLLRRSGLSGAGINQVVDASQAPKGSVYHYFPGGKQQLVTEALRAAERTVGESFHQVFRAKAPVGSKVRTLFTRAAASLEANEFAKGCPVAAVTLDLDHESQALREVCDQVFDRWVNVIAQGLDDVPQGDRRTVAQLILATLEGGLILARAQGTKAPLVESGNTLATLLAARFATHRRARRT
jgi:TetR/AcrR family transcriptional repressor of lmrAB and yxaGH operons